MALPFTVIGGYLGSGKTTLVNRLLADAGGRRILVMVNDFGDIAVDAQLVDGNDGDTISFANGCVCCSLADGFAAGLARVRARSDRFDHIVVEVSGVGDPRSVAQWGRTPGFALDAIIVLADAERIRDQVADPYVGETVVAQLAAADLVALTKLDLVDDQQEEAAGAAIAAATDAPVVRHPVPLEWVPAPPLGRPRARAGPHATHLTRTAVIARPLAREQLLRLLADRPEGVVRVKGIVPLVDEDDPVVVQVVGRRVEVTPASLHRFEAPPAIVAVAVPGTSEDRLDGWIGALEGRPRPSTHH